MNILRIEDARDWTYPFTRVLYEDPHVVYHGTASAYSRAIEADGFVLGRMPFSINLLRHLVVTADQIGFRSWSYTTVKGLSRGTELSSEAPRPIYFSANFWFARDYATSIGGETIHNAIQLSTELEEQLQRLGAPSLALADEVQGVRAQLEALIVDSYPIVYAVRVQPDWLDHGSALEREQLGSLVVTSVNVACKRSVPVDRVLAKVEYVKGAESGYLGPQPASWVQAKDLGQF